MSSKSMSLKGKIKNYAKTAPMVKTGRKRRNAGRRKTEKHLYNGLG